MIVISPTLPKECGTINKVAVLLTNGFKLGIACSLKKVF
jgi:hypothetical protein